MKSITAISLALGLFLGFSGCKKDALEADPAFEGTWLSTYYSSYGGWKCDIRPGEASWMDIHQRVINEGKPKIRKDVLYIGRGDYRIDQYPAYDADGNYVMKLSGIGFFGAKVPANPAGIVTGTTVTFGWDFLLDDDPTLVVEIDYKTASSSAWTTISAPSRPGGYELTGLAQGSYEWRMRGVNNKLKSGYTAVNTFIIQ